MTDQTMGGLDTMSARSPMALFAAILATLAAAAAHAQTASKPPETAGPVLEEVTVTATRR